ncbi:MAG: hypothetical protein AAFR87_33760 [Bacteroidota bacterium]
MIISSLITDVQGISIITEEAAEEIEAIRNFNEGRKQGRGFDSLEDILDCLDRIHKNTGRFQYYRNAKDGIRRGVSARFAIIVLYDKDHEKERIELLNVADSQQDWFED